MNRRTAIKKLPIYSQNSHECSCFPAAVQLILLIWVAAALFEPPCAQEKQSLHASMTDLLFLCARASLKVAWSFIKSLEMFMGALVRSTHFLCYDKK